MSLIHITVDPFGRIYHIAKMFDKFANETLDPVLAESCVIEHTPDGPWTSLSCDEVPIYTVH